MSLCCLGTLGLPLTWLACDGIGEANISSTIITIEPEQWISKVEEITDKEEDAVIILIKINAERRKWESKPYVA